MKKTLDDSVLSQEDSDQSVGRDTQFELFVGAVCCAAGLTPVDFEEPDVSCTVKGVKFGIAAKRLKNIENFEKRIRKAAKQIKASRLPGIIALDVCLAGNPENARVWQPIPDQEFAALWSAGLTRFVGRYHSRLQEWVRGKGVRGLVIHDHQVRLGLDKKWELDGMHFFVDAARENQRRHREFVAFQSQYRMGLPNLKVLG